MVSEVFDCRVLNKNGSYRFIYLIWSQESVTISKCGFVGVVMAVLGEVCHWGWNLKF